MKRIFKRRWQKAVALSLVALMVVAGADQLIAGGLAGIASQALSNLQGDDEEVIPPSLAAYLEGLAEDYEYYYSEQEEESLLPPSVLAFEESNEEGSTYEEVSYYNYLENIQDYELFEGYTTIDDLLEELGLNPADFYIGNYGGPSPFADAFLNASPLMLSGAFAGVATRTAVTVTTEAELRSFVSGAGWPAGVTATTPVQINLGATIPLTGGASNSLNLNSFFHDIYISSPVNAAGNATFAITADGGGSGATARVNPAIRVGHSGAPGRRAYIRANVISTTGSANDWQGIRVEHASTLSLRGNVQRTNRRSNGHGSADDSGVSVRGGSTFNFERGTIQMFRLGVHLGGNSTMTMNDDFVHPLGTDDLLDQARRGVHATTIIQSNRGHEGHTETGGGGDGQGLGDSGNNGGGVWVTGNSTFNFINGRIGTSNVSDRYNGNASRGGGGVRVLDGSSMTITGGTIVGNRATAQAPIENTISGSLDNRGGGGVMVDGPGAVLNMHGGFIYSNMRSGHASAWDVNTALVAAGGSSGGGGVYVGRSASFYMTGGTIAANTARRGGGVLLNGANTTFVMSGSALIQDNINLEQRQNLGGGGVHVGHSSTFTMDGGNIFRNAAVQGYASGVQRGGGVFVMPRGHFQMNGGTISDNRSGNARNSSATNAAGNPTGSVIDPVSAWNLRGDRVFASSDSHGGGVMLFNSTSTMNMTGGFILQNQAGSGGGISMGQRNADGDASVTVSGTSIPIPNRRTAADGAVNITGGWIVGNHAFNTSNVAATRGGGGGIATHNSTGTSNLQTNTVGWAGDYGFLTIGPDVVIAGNTNAGNHEIGSVSSARAWRNDTTFNDNPQVQPNLTTFDSFATTGARAGQMNPFNNLDIRVTGGTNFNVRGPAVYRFIYIYTLPYASATATFTPANRIHADDGGRIRGEVRLLSRPTITPASMTGTLLTPEGQTLNVNYVAVNEAGATLATGNYFQYLGLEALTDEAGRHWRSGPSNVFQYSFVQTFLPSYVAGNIPGQTSPMTGQGWQLLNLTNVPSNDPFINPLSNGTEILTGVGTAAAPHNRLQFTMPPFPVDIAERYVRFPVNPGEIELTADRLDESGNPVTTIPQGSMFPVAVNADGEVEFDEDGEPLGVRPPGVLAPLPINASVIDGTALERPYGDTGATLTWSVVAVNNASDNTPLAIQPEGIYVTTYTYKTHEVSRMIDGSLVDVLEFYYRDGSRVPLRVSTVNDPLNMPNHLPGPTSNLEVRWDVPVGTVLRVRLTVTSPHTPAGNDEEVIYEDIFITVTNTPRRPYQIIVHPLGEPTGIAPNIVYSVAMRQSDEERFNAVVYSQFLEDISAHFPVTWTQPMAPASPNPNDNYLDIDPVAFEAEGPAGPGVPHRSIDVEVDLDATEGTLINLTATIPPSITPPPSAVVGPITLTFIAPPSAVVGYRRVDIAAVPRYINNVIIMPSHSTIIAGNTNANWNIIEDTGATYATGTAPVSTLQLNRHLRSQFNEVIGIPNVYDAAGDIVTPGSAHYPTASVTWSLDYVMIDGDRVYYYIPDEDHVGPGDAPLIPNPDFPRESIFVDPVTGLLTAYYTATGVTSVRVRATANSENHTLSTPGIPAIPAGEEGGPADEVPADNYYEYDTFLITVTHPVSVPTTVVMLDNETLESNLAQDDYIYLYARVFDQFGRLIEVDLNMNWTIAAAEGDSTVVIAATYVGYRRILNPEFDPDYAGPVNPHPQFIMSPAPGFTTIRITASSAAVFGVTRVLTATVQVSPAVVGVGASPAVYIEITHDINITPTRREAASVEIEAPVANIYVGEDHEYIFIYYGNIAAVPAVGGAPAITPAGSAVQHYITLTATALSQFEEELPAEGVGADMINHWTLNPQFTWEFYPDGDAPAGITILPSGVTGDNTAQVFADFHAAPGVVQIKVRAHSPNPLAANPYIARNSAYHIFEIVVRSTPAFQDSVVLRSAVPAPDTPTPPINIIQNGSHNFIAVVRDQFGREMITPVPILDWTLQAPVAEHITNTSATINVGSNAVVGSTVTLVATSGDNAHRYAITASGQTAVTGTNRYASGTIEAVVTQATRFPHVIEVATDGVDSLDVNSNLDIHQGWTRAFTPTIRNQFTVEDEDGNSDFEIMVVDELSNNNDSALPALTWSFEAAPTGTAGTHANIDIDPATGEITVGRNAVPQDLTVRVRANDRRRDANTNALIDDDYAVLYFTVSIQPTVRFANEINILAPTDYDLHELELETQVIFEIEVIDQFGDVLPSTHDDFPNLIWTSSRDDVSITPLATPSYYQRNVRALFVYDTDQVGEISVIRIQAGSPRILNIPADKLPADFAAGTYAYAVGNVEIGESYPRPIAAAIFRGDTPIGGKVPIPNFDPSADDIMSQFHTIVAPVSELERVQFADLRVEFYDRLGRVVVDPDFLDAAWDIVEHDTLVAPAFEAGAVDGSIYLNSVTNEFARVTVEHNAATFDETYTETAPTFFVRVRSTLSDSDDVFATVQFNVVHHNRTPVEVGITNLINQFGEVYPHSHLLTYLEFNYDLDGFGNGPDYGVVQDVYADYYHRFVAVALDRLGYPTNSVIEWSRNLPHPSQPTWSTLTQEPRANISVTNASGVEQFAIELSDYGNLEHDAIFRAEDIAQIHNLIFTVTASIPGTTLSHSVNVRVMLAANAAIEIATFPTTEQNTNNVGGDRSIYLGTFSNALEERVFNYNTDQDAIVGIDGGRNTFTLPPSYGLPNLAEYETPLIDVSGNWVHARWSIIPGYAFTLGAPDNLGLAAYNDPYVTIDPITGVLNVAGGPGEIANRDLINEFIYVRVEFETDPYPRFFRNYYVARIRIADPPRVPTYVRIFAADSLPASVSSEDMFDYAVDGIPLVGDGGMMAIRAVVFDQLRYPYPWSGSIVPYRLSSDIGIVILDNPGFLGFPSTFPHVVVRMDINQTISSTVFASIDVPAHPHNPLSGTTVTVGVPIENPVFAPAAFGLFAPVILDFAPEYTEEAEVEVILPEEEVSEEYEEEVYEYELILEEESEEDYEEEDSYESYEEVLAFEVDSEYIGIAAYALGGVLAAVGILFGE